MTEKPGKSKSTAKRDFIHEIQQNIQKKWKEAKLFESNTDEKKEKFLITFPYPYMNGFFHLGHAFSMTKAEFVGRFQRMKGKNVLWPFGYHCTGMPIVACANKLKEEITKYGNPPKFPDNKNYQWRILQKNGFSDEQIPNFQDPIYWIQFFPAQAREQLDNFGMGIDFRRSFITTHLNPYYNRFIEWQFNTLKKLGLLSFGKRCSIYSIKDKQPCADHDRSRGEGVKTKEFVCVKQKLVQPYPKCLDGIPEDKKGKVYLGAATLRPETMYGQTNCWLKPNGNYGAYVIKDGSVIIVSEVAARNFAYQEIMLEDEKHESIVPIFKGKEFFGHKLNAPLTKMKEIYILPMETIDMKKTTGVVTSCPSDSPDDYAATIDLRKNEKLRSKYGIDEKWVDFEIIPILKTEKFGNMSAVTIYEKLKIKNQRDPKLKAAHDEIYKEGFHNGTMTIGKYSGKPVRVVKDLIKNDMCKSGEAFVYNEPEELVVSRSGDVCVAALTDQWYIKYGDEDWKKKVLNHIESDNFSTYNEQIKKEYVATVDWLREWGISRSFGLGTFLPWDKQYVIESLSDSTIYMAFYTIANSLQGDIFGKTQGTQKVKPEEMTDEAFDYIFRSGEYKKECVVPKEKLDHMKKQFQYWYPVNLRTSAKDLIKNHLTFFLFNHAAIFEEKYMPRSIFTNGYINVNKKKMSKGEGNFILLKQALEDYTADGVRLTLADAGDTLDDANFDTSVATNSVLRLWSHVKWCQDISEEIKKGSLSKSEYNLFDKMFDAIISETIVLVEKAFESMRFKEALKYGWFMLTSAKDTYEYRVGTNNMKESLVKRFLEISTKILNPFIPHTCDYIWQEILKKEGFVTKQEYPKQVEYDNLMIKLNRYLEGNLHQFRITLTKDKRALRKKKIKPDSCIIYLKQKFEDWQLVVLETLKDMVKNDGKINMKEFPKEMKKKGIKTIKDAMQFCAAKKREFDGMQDPTQEEIEEFFSPSGKAFEEEEFIKQEMIVELIKKELKMENVTIIDKDDPSVKNKKRADQSLPFKPSISFFKK